MREQFNNKDTLIAVVDMVNGFCVDGNLSSAECWEVKQPIYEFLRSVPSSFKAFIRDCHTENSVEFNTFPSHCDNETECALVDELKGIEGLDITKNSTNAFFSLIKALPDIDRFKRVLIIGVCTDICVMQLALTLKAYFDENNFDIDVFSAENLTATYDAPDHNAREFCTNAFTLMKQVGVKIIEQL